MPLSNNIRWLLLLIFTITSAALVWTLYQFPLNWGFILTDAIASGAILTGTVGLGIVVVRAYPTNVGILVYALLIGVVFGIAAWYLDRLALKWWFNTDLDYLGWFKTTQLTRLIVALLINCWLITLTAVNQRSAALEHQFKNITDAGKLHREAELFKLRQQLQPHFLYNSLNSINALILIQPDKAQEMIGRLSDFLRNSVKREAREQIPIDEEFEYIEAYLAIEAVRFGDRLKIEYNKDYTDSATIPPFLLQPILENAIKFGLYGRVGDVSINLHIMQESPYLVLTITNPFDPNNRPPSGTGFGLEGIQRRLYLLYGRTDLLETNQEEELFTTILKIPQHHV